MIHKTHPIAKKLTQKALEQTENLLKLLTDEAQLLTTKPQFQTLEAITEQKKTLINQLNTFSSQVEQILATEKLDKQSGMLEYFAIAQKNGLDTTESLNHWKKLTHLAKKCQVLNEQNGACIHILNRHNQRILNILKGGNQAINTYSRDGRTKASLYSQTLISV